MKKIICVQPEYVREFKCDGSKCNARCCRGWNVLIDDATFKQYSNVEPKIDAEKILALLKFNSEYGKYLVALDGMNCPFLNENNLCRLQLKYGESFLSEVCATYPRKLFDFGQFFERSLTLSCPVAAEIILLRDAPLKFELVTENLRDVKREVTTVEADEGFCEKMFNVQVTAISILQRHTLTLDQRLIALGFFLDKFDEIFAAGMNDNALEKLFAVYESESFWSKQFPKLLTAVKFDSEKFWEQMLKVLVEIYGGKLRDRDQKFLVPFIETFGIIPDEKKQIFVADVAANYERLADERKKFLSRRAMFMENFLVNEFFILLCPWNFKASVTKNFGVLVTKYKLFELITFAASQRNYVRVGDNSNLSATEKHTNCSAAFKAADKELIELTSWLMRQADHEKFFTDSILATVPDDIFSAMETLLEP